MACLGSVTLPLGGSQLLHLLYLCTGAKSSTKCMHKPDRRGCLEKDSKCTQIWADKKGHNNTYLKNHKGVDPWIKNTCYGFPSCLHGHPKLQKEQICYHYTIRYSTEKLPALSARVICKTLTTWIWVFSYNCRGVASRHIKKEKKKKLNYHKSDHIF